MFETIAKDFVDGGSWMLPVVALGVALWSGLLATLIAQLVAQKPRLTLVLAKLVGALALATIAFGALGSVSTLRTLFEAVAHVQPSDSEVILMAGADEALILFQYALGLAVVPGVAAWFFAGLNNAAPKAA